MPRWPAGAQERLQESAIALFDEQGYDRTTVAQIARRAGLTERTFYNHFADKREILFPGQQQYLAELAVSLRDAPADARPLDVVMTALAADSEWFDERRDAGTVRRRIIDAHPELRERERSKLAAITDVISGVLVEQGETADAAFLTASSAVAAYELASRRWADDPAHAALREHQRVATERLRAAAQDW